MRARICACLSLLMTGTVAAQRPSDPALLIPEQAPPLDYAVAERAVTLPEGVVMGAPASVDFDASGHLFVLTRGERSFFEFDENGAFLRSFGDRLFTRAHGLRIDAHGHLWATDVSAHVVLELDRDGNVLLTLGTPGEAGEWNEAAGSRRLNQPNDVAIAPNGDIFVVQGHTPGPGGDARVLKFDHEGRFLTQWGGKGNAPGKFQVAHGIDIDADGRLWVLDRENQRIQVFEQDGTFVREQHYAGLPCGLDIGEHEIFMVNGFAGQVLELDLSGKVIAALGKPGNGPGEFGEAHMIAASKSREILVADSVNATLTRLVPR